MTRASPALENAALRQQLAIYQRTHKRVHFQSGDRLFWVALRRLWPGWTGPLIKELWACDFLIQHTALYTVAYIFIIMEIHSRRIVHVNVTTNPTLPWVKQQIRQATPWAMTPHLLVHDNDGIFGQYGRKVTVEGDDRKRSYRCQFDRWADPSFRGLRQYHIVAARSFVNLLR
jgi:hypothetical protein